MRSHLFLALSRFAFGEAALGVRLAHALHARGEQITFLTPATLSPLTRGAPFRHGVVDAAWANLEGIVADLLTTQRCDSLTLIDAASVFLVLAALGRTEQFLARVRVPLLALDVWDLPATDRGWDLGPDHATIPERAGTIARRLVPVPFARPHGGGARFNAIPVASPASAAERQATRTSLGLPPDATLIVTTTARWQTAGAQVDAYQRRLAQQVPAIALAQLAQLGPNVRIAHVGPEPWDAGREVAGYQWIPQLPPARFERLLAAADLLVTMNQSATTIGSALALGVPVVVLINSIRAADPGELAAQLSPRAPAAWRELAPLYPFRVWPLGLHRFLAPILEHNPYVDAIGVAELLDPDQVATVCGGRLYDPAVRAAADQRRSAYLAQVARLPSGADAFLALLAP